MTPADSVPTTAPESAEGATVLAQGFASEAGDVIVFTPPEEHTDASVTSVYVPFTLEAAENVPGTSDANATSIVVAGSTSDLETSAARGLTWWQSSAALLIAALTALTPFSSRRRVDRHETAKSRLRLRDQKPE